MKKNNNLIIIILSIIIIILIVLCILFATNKIDFNKEKTSKQSNQTTQEKQVKTTWADYLLSQKIISAKVKRIKLGENAEIIYDKEISLNKENIKEILTGLENKKITKVWVHGSGGFDFNSLYINYEKNNQEYQFSFRNGEIFVDKLDNDFINLIDNGNYDEDVLYKNYEGSFYLYRINDNYEEIFNKYFE